MSCSSELTRFGKMPSERSDVKELLAEIEKEIEEGTILEATVKELPEQPGAMGCIGRMKSLTFILVEFDIEGQGFPPGSKGYDGTIVRGGTIMRLPRELAEKLYKKAAKT